MKKGIVYSGIVIGIVGVIALGIIVKGPKANQGDFLGDLEGTLYYTRRVEGVSTLFKSDATMENESLVYSHEGKGHTALSDNNDNILDFYYDKVSGDIYFIAMNDGKWSEFKRNSEGEVGLLDASQETTDHVTALSQTNYITPRFQGQKVIEKEGALYLVSGEEESLMVPFHGIYDEKLTGNSPVGFSPDGKYFIYRSRGHMTPVGTLIEGLVKDQVSQTYIYDFETKQSQEIKNIYNIQWEMN